MQIQSQPNSNSSLAKNDDTTTSEYQGPLQAIRDLVASSHENRKALAGTAVEDSLQAVLTPSDPNQTRFQPVVDWEKYQDARQVGKGVFNFGLTAGIALPGASILPFVSGNLIYGGIFVALGALSYVIAGIGFRGAKINKVMDEIVYELSDKQVRAWLLYNYNVKPLKAWDDHNRLLTLVNDGYRERWDYPFFDQEGEEYRLYRNKQNARLKLVNCSTNYEVPPKKRILPGINQAQRTASEGDLQIFGRRDRARIRAAREIIAENMKSELSVETKFALTRATTMLDDVIKLGQKLTSMPYSARKQGLDDLSEVLDTVSTELTDLNLEQHRTTLRQTRILARYSRNIRKRPTNPTLDLN